MCICIYERNLEETIRYFPIPRKLNTPWWWVLGKKLWEIQISCTVIHLEGRSLCGLPSSVLCGSILCQAIPAPKGLQTKHRYISCHSSFKQEGDNRFPICCRCPHSEQRIRTQLEGVSPNLQYTISQTFQLSTVKRNPAEVKSPFPCLSMSELRTSFHTGI